MKTNNELIAEFMGLKFDGVYYHKGKEVYRKEELQYDSSWEWIMKVVDKIRMLKEFRKEEPFANVLDSIALFDKKEANKAIVNFIKWHNQQN